jgi:[ribosomal protein S5]-alanine N-acetyltransferase
MSDHREIQTSRLILRPLCEDDIPSLFAIQSNGDAMRFTYTAPSLDECTRRLRAYEDSRARHGFAPWVVIDRSASLVVGWGGLNVDPFDPGWGIEISYFFHPAFWGRGYATELVLTSLSHAFEASSISQVSAFAMPNNVGSVRVLEKCGFNFLRYEPRLERNHYQANRASRSIQPNNFESHVFKATRT